MEHDQFVRRGTLNERFIGTSRPLLAASRRAPAGEDRRSHSAGSTNGIVVRCVIHPELKAPGSIATKPSELGSAYLASQPFASGAPPRWP
jgi:hypothetical protein